MTAASLDRDLFELGTSVPAAAATPGQAEYVDGRAIIAWRSILDDIGATITASSEATGFAAENVRSRLTYSGWMPTSGGTEYLYFTFDAGKTADYLGIAAHTLASDAAPVDLQWSDDGLTGWTSVLGGGYAPSSDGPFLLLFASVAKRYWRLAVYGSGVAPLLGVLMFGERLSLQRGIYVGHAPAPYQARTRFQTEESEGGQIIGSSVLSQAFETGAELRRITPTWARTYFVPFLKQAVRRLPFFFMWNTDDRYKGEVLYATLTNEPQLANEHQSFMSTVLQMRGLA